MSNKTKLNLVRYNIYFIKFVTLVSENNQLAVSYASLIFFNKSELKHKKLITNKIFCRNVTFIYEV